MIVILALRSDHDHPSPIDWALEPTVIAGLAALTALYLLALRSQKKKVDHKTILFMLGNLSLLLALVSPLEVLSDHYLFSAHMVQHLILMTIAPPLWLLGTPDFIFVRLLQQRQLALLARALTYPPTAFLVFNGVFWVWHLPALYDLALGVEAVHIAQHLTFLAAGTIGWWPVLASGPNRLRDPLRALYLFATCQPNAALGALFFFARDVIYTSYLEAPRTFDLTPKADQQLGGLIMWIPGNAVYLLALSVILLRWLYRDAVAATGEGQPTRRP